MLRFFSKIKPIKSSLKIDRNNKIVDELKTSTSGQNKDNKQEHNQKDHSFQFNVWKNSFDSQNTVNIVSTIILAIMMLIYANK